MLETNYEWVHDSVAYIFFMETRLRYFQESRLSLVCGLGQVSETGREREIRVREKDGDGKRLKNYRSL